MRYTSEISLRLYGDRTKAARYIGRARAVLGELWNREILLGTQTQAWRRVFLDDDIFLSVRIVPDLPPLVEITAVTVAFETTIEQPAFLFAAWRPEGLLFTPASDALPDGKGLPHRNPDATGAVLAYTAAGPLPQVIMNQYRNNLYLDDPNGLVGTTFTAELMNGVPSPQLRNAYSTPIEVTWNTAFEYWLRQPVPLSYGATPAPGVYIGRDFWATDPNAEQYPIPAGEYLVSETLVEGKSIRTANLIKPQRSATDQPIITEAESPLWYAHRPQEVLYKTDAHEAIFRETNVLRQAVGRDPVLRQLRGDGVVAYCAVNECALSGDFSHNSSEFRPGMEDIASRLTNGMSDWAAGGENLVGSATLEGTTTAIGEAAVAFWESSPGHYANMVSILWDREYTVSGTTVSGGSLQIGYEIGTVDRQTEDIPNIPAFPPGGVSGGLWCQSFTTRFTWTGHAPDWIETDFGPVGWAADGTGGYSLSVNPSTTFAYLIYFRNIRFSVPNSFQQADHQRMLGATVYEKTPGELWFRAVFWVANVDFSGDYRDAFGQCTVRIYTAPVGLMEPPLFSANSSYRPNPQDLRWEIESEYVFPADYIYPAFIRIASSSDGRKICFTMQKYYTETQAFIGLYQIEVGEVPLASDKAVVELVHVEKTVDSPTWTLNVVPALEATVSAVTVTSGPDTGFTSYERTLKGSVDYYPYYDSANVLRFVTYELDDFQSCFRSSYAWSVRKLVFPSGKEVYTTYDWIENFVTPTAAQFKLDHPLFPRVDSFGDQCFRTVIHSLHATDEDVLFQRAYWTRIPSAVNDPQSAGTSQGIVEVVGDATLEVDLGSGTNREQTELIRRTDMFVRSPQDQELTTFNNSDYSFAQSDLQANSSFAAGSAEWHLEYDIVNDSNVLVTIESFENPKASGANKEQRVRDAVANCRARCVHSNMFYDYYEWWSEGYSVAFVANAYRNAFRSSEGLYANWPFGRAGPAAAPGFGSFRPAALDPGSSYNDTTYLRAHALNYHTSVFHAYPRSSRRMMSECYNLPQLAALASEEELFAMDNIAPMMAQQRFMNPTQIVRYKDRVLLNIDHRYITAWGRPERFVDGQANPPGSLVELDSQVSGWFGPFEATDTLHANVRIGVDGGIRRIVWANFDLDAMAEITNVNKITPFGRVI